MKKYVAICTTLAALAFTGVAAAALPQLTGTWSLAGSSWTVGDAIFDGGTTYVGLENDYSGTCTGDTGTFILNGVDTRPVLCAHWVKNSGKFMAGSPKMRFAFQSSVNPNVYFVIRINDNGVWPDNPDWYGTGITTSLNDAIAWVNTGAVGSGHLFSAWSLGPVTEEGDYIITH